MKRAAQIEIDVHEFRIGRTKPRLLFFGAVHGNETCGTQAINRVIAEILSGKIRLLKGCVTFVPVANPVAYAHGIRYVDENLNRIFKVTRKPGSIEAQIANHLCKLIKACDVFLDIHSTTAKGRPFIYLDFPTKLNRHFAKNLGPQFCVTGWPEFYEKSGKKHLSYDTTTYAAQQGKDCLLIECGQHQERSAEAVAYKAILNTMLHYGMIEGKLKSRSFKEIKITAGYFRENAKDRLAKNWKHLDKVRKGDPLILKADGQILKSTTNSYIIMPKATAGVGDDWLYLGRVVRP